MKPLIHAKISVKKYGGVVEDYLPIHDFFDSSKAALPDIRHRAVLHNAFGIFIAEKVFGTFIVNADGKDVSVRDIGEDHVIDDLGFIPTLEQWLTTLPVEGWMSGTEKKVKTPKEPAKDPELVLDGAKEHFDNLQETLKRLEKPLEWPSWVPPISVKD